MQDAAWVKAYIGLGANLGEPLAQLRKALNLLDESENIELIQHSSFYRSVALLNANNNAAQDDYCNAVAEIRTGLNAHDLLAVLQTIEQQMGRDRSVARWSARCIDLDLLLYADENINSADLVVPHPEMHKRNFVMTPLREIAPTAVISDFGTVQHLALRVGNRGLTMWEQDA